MQIIPGGITISSVLISLSLSLFGAPLLAQTPESVSLIEGTVTSQEGTPLSNVNVSIEGYAFGAVTTKSGGFSIPPVPPGTYTLVVSRIGFQTARQIIQIGKNEGIALTVTLQVQPIELSELRVTVIGNPDKIGGIPGSSHYIGPVSLGRHEDNDINRVLREIPGINIQEEDGYGLRPNIGMRGTGVERSEKITLMEDGVLIAPAPYAAPAAYYFPTVGRMEGVEVRKGSSQIKYGPYTTGGALNLISARIPYTLGGRFNLTVGQNGEQRIQAKLGDSYRNFGWLAETYLTNVDGFKELDGGGDTGFDKKDYMVKFRVNTDPEDRFYQKLTLKIGQTDEISNETYLGLTDADFNQNPYRRYAASQNDRMDAQHRQFQARYFLLPNRFLDITTTFYRNEFNRNWYKLDKVKATSVGKGQRISSILENPETFGAEYSIVTGTTSPNDDALEVKANNREYYSQGIQSIFGVRYGRRAISNELEIGIRYHQDEMDRFQWIDKFRMDNRVMKLTQSGTRGTESNRIESARAWAIFIQDHLAFGNFTAIPGLRFEDIRIERKDYGVADPGRTGSSMSTRQNNVSVWIPGMGLNYNFTPGFNTFVGVHKGFSPPGSKKETKPEKSINYEWGIRVQEKALEAYGVVFFNDYDNLLGSDLASAGGQSQGDLFNGGEVDVKGLELSIGYDFGKAVQYSIPLRFAYTYTSAEFKNDFKSDFGPWGTVTAGFGLPYLPSHQLSSSIGLEGHRWGINLKANYVGRMRTKAGAGVFTSSKSTDARLVIDTSGEAAISSNAKFFVRVRNLTDRTFIVARRPAGVRPGLPRSFTAGIQTNF